MHAHQASGRWRTTSTPYESPCGRPMPERIVGLTGGWKLPICLQETREFPGSASQIHLSQSPPMTTTRLLLRGTPARGPRLGALLGLCVLSLVFTLAFTASTSGTSGAATLRMAAKHKASSAKSLSAFQACLSKHGLKLPTRGGSKGGPPSGFSGGTPPSSGGTPPSLGGSGGFGANSKTQAALKQCANLQPKGGFPGGAGGSSSTAFASYRNCMKLHGVTVPSVTPGSNTSTSTTVDTSSPTYQAAQTACKALLPTGSGTTSGSSG